MYLRTLFVRVCPAVKASGGLAPYPYDRELEKWASDTSVTTDTSDRFTNVLYDCHRIDFLKSSYSYSAMS